MNVDVDVDACRLFLGELKHALNGHTMCWVVQSSKQQQTTDTTRLCAVHGNWLDGKRLEMADNMLQQLLPLLMDKIPELLAFQLYAVVASFTGAYSRKHRIVI